MKGFEFPDCEINPLDEERLDLSMTYDMWIEVVLGPNA